MKELRFIVSILAAAAVLAACKSTGTAFNPPGGSSIIFGHGILVSDVVNNQILTFPLDANGASAMPSATLSGAATSLDQPEGIFVDRHDGTIWVGNYTSGTSGTITEYAFDARGNAAPMKTIGGPATTIAGPGGIYVDSSGTLYVADFQTGDIDVFAAGASGNVAPTRQITGLGVLSGLWLDASGNIWVGSPGQSAILEFANNTSGAATPIATIKSPDLGEVIGVYIDGHQNVWAANCDTKNVVEFAAGSTGSSVTPTVDISGSNTGFTCPNGIVVDSSGKIYVGDYGAASVYVFAPGTNGNVAPTQTIPANATTTLGKPIGVIVY
ncbi:MAG: hypothetical protein ACREMP_10300 [Candidatus Tyrphobacter sp.]